MKARFRKWIGQAHRWLGIILGIYVCLIGLTGAVLSFKAPIDRLCMPRLLSVPPSTTAVPLDRLMETVRAHHPGAMVVNMRPPAAPDEPALFGINEMYGPVASVDPHTGAYLGALDERRLFTGWVYRLHMNLLLSEPGGKANGIISLFAVALFVSGLWIWWPRRLGQWRARLTIQPTAGPKRRLHDLHNVFGYLSFPVLFVTFLSGALFMYPEIGHRIVDAATLSAHEPDTAARPAGAPPAKLSPGRLLEIADRLGPSARYQYIQFPMSPTDGAMFNKEIQFGSCYSIVLDPADGHVIQIDDESRYRGSMAWSLMTRLHFGDWGGFGSHVLYALVGLCPIALGLTGFLQWWGRRAAVKANAARRTMGSNIT